MVVNEVCIRKREIVHICDGSDSGSVAGDVLERSVLESLVPVPVHSKHASIIL